MTSSRPPEALERIGGKWSVRILEALWDRTLRFGELRDELGGISEKVLTQALRSLERDGLIRRRRYGGVPPRVEYCVTQLGASLRDPLTALRRWTRAHLAEVCAARHQYDAEQKRLLRERGPRPPRVLRRTTPIGDRRSDQETRP